MPKSDFDRKINNYLSELSGVKRVSENTTTAYRKDLLQFKHFLESKDIFSYKKITERHIRLFLVELNELKLERSTIQTTLKPKEIFRRLLHLTLMKKFLNY